MTMNKFFTKDTRLSNNRTPVSGDKKEHGSSKSPTPKPMGDLTNKSSKEKGTDRLKMIQKDLTLNVRNKNIMDPKILETWINETLVEVERLDQRGIS